MKTVTKRLAAMAAILVMSVTAVTAQAKTVRVGTGSETGTYFGIGTDIDSFCGTEMSEASLELFPSGGSVANLDGMNTKQFTAGIVQEDVLRLYSKFLMPKKVNEKRIRVITPLHVEPLNLLIPVNYKPEGQKVGFFAKLWGSDDAPVKLDINLLRNQQVAAWGGSMVSAQALSRYLGLDFSVREIAKGQTAKGRNGEIPILVVEGFPSKVVQQYLDSGKYRLVSIDYDKVKVQADFYVPHKLSYTVKGKVVNVDTIGTRALLVGKASRKASRNLPMEELASCIEESLIDLADDADTNSNWSEIFEFVDDENTVDWKYFNLAE